MYFTFFHSFKQGWDIKGNKDGGREKANSEKLQRITTDEEGEFPLSFCIKAKHDKPHQYMLREKPNCFNCNICQNTIKN